MRNLLLASLLLACSTSGSSSERPVRECGTLDRPGTTYILQKDVSSPGTCFLIAADRVTLDLNNHTVTYATGGKWERGQETIAHFHGVLGQACWDRGGKADPAVCADSFAFLTVKNGALIQAEGAPPYSHGIRVGQGRWRAPAFENLRIRIHSPSSVGILVTGGYGGTRLSKVTVENQSVHVFNRHQLEGAAVRLVDVGKNGDPDIIDGLRVIDGPQLGVLDTAPGSKITNSHIALQGAFTNDFGIMLFGDRSRAASNTIAGRSRGIQVNARNIVVESNVIDTFEDAVNAEYGGCQMEGTFGIQLERGAARALVTKNDVRVRARACDARAFRATATQAGSNNRSTGNFYRALKDPAVTKAGVDKNKAQKPGRPVRAVAASFSGAKDIVLEGDTLEADTWNAEINFGGGTNIVLRGVTFIKGANAREDYATFALLPGSDNPTDQRILAELRVIDPIFRQGAAADSFFMHPTGFQKWVMPAEYSIQWTFNLKVVSADNAALSGVSVNIVDQRGASVAQAVTDSDGRIPSLPLTAFRRFNTPQSIEKEVFSYVVKLTLGERRQEFKQQLSEPVQRVEILR